jgi:hypothetical protein
MTRGHPVNAEKLIFSKTPQSDRRYRATLQLASSFYGRLFILFCFFAGKKKNHFFMLIFIAGILSGWSDGGGMLTLRTYFELS